MKPSSKLEAFGPMAGNAEAGDPGFPGSLQAEANAEAEQALTERLLARASSSGARSVRFDDEAPVPAPAPALAPAPAPSDSESESGANEGCGRWLWLWLWRGEPSVWHVLPVCFLFVLQTMLVATEMPIISAGWFTTCDESTVACEPNFETAQAVTGMVDSLRNLLAFFSAALVGRLSDVFGRKPVLMAGLLVTCIPTLALYATSGASPVAYYSACVLAGLLGAGSTPAVITSVMSAYVADSYRAADRAKNFGLVAAASSVSLIVNPAVAVVTRRLAFQQLCLLSLLAVAGILVCVQFLVPESLPPSRRNAFSVRRTLSPGAPLRLLAQSRITRWVALLVLMGGVAEAGVREISLAYCDKVLGLRGEDAKLFNTLLFACIGVTMLVTNVGVLRVFLRLGMRGSTLLGIAQLNNALHMSVYALLHWMPHRWVMFANAVPTAMTILAGVAASTLVSAHMGPQEQGFALGTLAAVNGVSDVLGPLLFSQLFAYCSEHYGAPQAPFCVGAVLGLLAAVLAWAGPLRQLEQRPKRLIATSHSMYLRVGEDDVIGDDDDVDEGDVVHDGELGELGELGDGSWETAEANGGSSVA